MLVGQREKSQKYFDLSASNWNLNDSNPWSSLGVMNFQKWELFSGSPGMRSTSSLEQIDSLIFAKYTYFWKEIKI